MYNSFYFLTKRNYRQYRQALYCILFSLKQYQQYTGCCFLSPHIKHWLHHLYQYRQVKSFPATFAPRGCYHLVKAFVFNLKPGIQLSLPPLAYKYFPLRLNFLIHTMILALHIIQYFFTCRIYQLNALYTLPIVRQQPSVFLIWIQQYSMADRLKQKDPPAGERSNRLAKKPFRASATICRK